MNKILLRRLIYKTTYEFDKLRRTSPVLFILSYHSISNDKWRFSVSISQFSKQMEYLSRNFNPVTVREIEDHISGKREIIKPSFAITFDDGYKNVLNAMNICKKLHIKPCIFVLSNPEEVNRQTLSTELPLLTKENLIKLHDAGWNIGCHGATHNNLSLLNKSELQKEISISKKILEKELGFKINYFSYPKSMDSLKIMGEVKKTGYRGAFTVGDKKINLYTDLFLIPRIGVDGSHSFSEFRSLFYPTTMFVRGLLRRTPWGATA